MINKMLFEESCECPECHSLHLTQDYGRGELVCNHCGLVVEDIYIDQGPEWRAFDSEQREKRARAGGPTDFSSPDKGFSTVIGWENKDGYGKAIPARTRAQLYRLRKWQYRIRKGRGMEKRISSALPPLDRLSAAMSLTRNIRDASIMIYRKALEKDLIKGRSIDVVMSAAVYAACRQCGSPRTIEEISLHTNIDKKDIGRTYRFLARELRLGLLPTSPQDYIERFCSELKLSQTTKQKAVQLLRQAHEKQLIDGKGPTGIAAATIYIASNLCDEPRIQRVIADVAGVTEVTIRSRYKELANKLNIRLEI